LGEGLSVCGEMTQDLGLSWISARFGKKVDTKRCENTMRYYSNVQYFVLTN